MDMNKDTKSSTPDNPASDNRGTSTDESAQPMMVGKVGDFDTRNKQIQDIVAQLRAGNSSIELILIEIPDDEEIYIARLCGWGEYKSIIGKTKDDGEINEVLVQKYLVHPKVDYEALQLDWSPGLVVTLAMKIQDALGFNQDEVTIKKL